MILEEKISEIFDCELSYANKIIASLKMNLPIQGSTPKQIYEGYSVIHSVQKLDKLYEFVYCEMTEESSYATISLHRTLEGAEKSMKEHKEAKRLKFEKEYKKIIIKEYMEDKKLDDNVRKELIDSIGEFDRFKDWDIYEIEVLD